MATDFAPPTSPTAAPAGELASTGRRIGGGIIDLLALTAVGAVFIALFGETESADGTTSVEITGLPALLMFLAWIAYYGVSEAVWGRTLGKALMGTRVVAVDGTKASASAVAVRTILRVVDGILLYLVAVIAVASSSRNQRLGDMAAKTLVIRG